MSLQRLAFLTAIGYHNQLSNSNNRDSNSNSNSDSDTHHNTTNTQSIMTTSAMMTPPTTSPSSTAARIPTSSTLSQTKITNSNKSTLIQLKQQHRPDIVLTTAATSYISATTTSAAHTALPQTPPSTPLATSPHQRRVFTTILATSSSTITARPMNPYINDHLELHEGGGSSDHQQQQQQQPHHHHTTSSSKTNSGGNNYSDSSEDGEAGASEHDGEETSGRQRPVNTFYGSGFGIFHQQRSSMSGTGGGGIALITGNSGSSSSSGLGAGSYSNGINNNVNLLLGGAMLTLITTILCVVCYCCHRNIKKRTEAAYRQQRQWLENDPNMEIYSVEQCYETSGLFVGDSMDGLATMSALHHEPPPSYDAVVAMQEQQQLIMQQQQQHLLMQQLQNSSPPPGYRSSLDVSCILSARAAALAPVALGMGSSDMNSLAASSTNLRAMSSQATPTEVNDLNGNRDMGAASTTTSASSQLQQHPNFMRTTKQRQRNLPTANLANFNMKKVLQAQSCCSLQRAEVENMWNAAAAALAARSNHVTTSDPRATASTSSPTLAMNNRKLSNAHSSKAETSETFGSRYLRQQNYYRRGCPLCGKFRYDNESTLSISLESDLDNLPIGECIVTGAAHSGRPIGDSRRLQDYKEENPSCGLEEEEGEDDECSCLNSNHNPLRQQYSRTVPTITTAVLSNQNYDNEITDTSTSQQNCNPENIELSSTAADLNANCPEAREPPSPTTATSLTVINNNNNNNNNNNELAHEDSSKPTTSSAAAEISQPTVSTSTSTTVGAINLDCINENGIISLDMSRIIDKTGLPTYDAALKLESSGYV